MFSIEAIDIKKICIHKINYDSDELELSEKYESLGANLSDYFTQHIRNIISSSTAKTGKFKSPDSTVAKCVDNIIENAEDLLENSKIITYWFFDTFKKDKASYCFLAFVEFIDVESNRRYVAILKLDPQNNYVYNNEGVVEQITTFPDASKPVNRGLVARPWNVDNQYDVVYRNQSVGKGEDPDMCRFFLDDFMETTFVPGPKYLTQLVLKETEKWVDKHSDVLGDEEPENLMNTVKTLAQSETMDVMEAANEAIEDEEMKVRYVNNLLDKGLTETVFAPDRAYAEKIAKKASYTLDYNIKLAGSREGLDEIMSYEKKDGKTIIELKTNKFIQK